MVLVWVLDEVEWIFRSRKWSQLIKTIEFLTINGIFKDLFLGGARGQDWKSTEWSEFFTVFKNSFTIVLILDWGSYSRFLRLDEYSKKNWKWYLILLYIISKLVGKDITIFFLESPKTAKIMALLSVLNQKE